MNILEQEDPDVWSAVAAEQVRQQDGLEMIASENFTSPAVMQAVGSVLTNKYAEGYPGRRYYGGCEFVDKVEDLARDRLKQVFGAEHVNVQPHSGSQANSAVYLAAIKPGDTVLAFDLAHGGHLTHGMKLNASGILYNFVHYGVRREDSLLDFDQVARLAKEHKPKLIVAGASAYPREIPHGRFAEIAEEVGAKLLVDMAHYAGLVAAGIHNSPIPVADFVTSTTHKTLRGPRGGFILTNDEELAKKIDKIVFPGSQGGPLMHVIAAKAVAFREALSPEFREYQQQVVKNARALVGTLDEKGFRVVSGGTDNHLGLIDLTQQGISGKKFERLLEESGITVNKNTIPNETRSPFVTSGIRIGTPALTSRGMKEDEMVRIGEWFYKVFESRKSEELLLKIRREVEEFARQFPMPWDR